MSYSKTDFPFNILDVINCLGINIHKVKGNQIYIDCPICGEKGIGKCEVLLSEGVYSCPRCNEFHGGMLDLFCYFHNSDKKEANRDMRKYVNDDSFKINVQRNKKIISAAEKQKQDNSELASRNVINKTYREFLKCLSLKQCHRDNLKRRGLSDKEISHYGFKSTPDPNETAKIASKLLLAGCSLKGVPGFYVDAGTHKWDINIYDKISGFFIPMMNLQNECVGLQIRLDHPETKMKDGREKIIKKYTWFSSKNMNEGVGRTTVPHITNTLTKTKTVYFTEGGLKADVAHSLSGKTFVAVAGVTQYKPLPIFFLQLRKNGVERIVDCFDSDCKYNENVEKARGKLKYYSQKAGLLYCRLDWDEKYKGIDDYLLAVPSGERSFNITY